MSRSAKMRKLVRPSLAGIALCLFAIFLTGELRAQGIQEWVAPDGKLYFGDHPPPGSKLVGATESMGTSGGGDVAQDAEDAQEARDAEHRPRARSKPPAQVFEPATGDPDAPVNAGVSLAKRNRLYFDTYSQRGLSPNELEIVQRNLIAVHNDVGRELRVDPDARFEVVLTEPEVFHRYSGTREIVSGLFNGKIHIPIPNGIKESELQGTLWHEYSHAVIFSKVGTKCPPWLNEGIAVHQQSKIDPSRRQNIRALVGPNGKLPYSWAELDETLGSQTATHEAVDLAYRQALAVVDYLYDRYSSRRVNDLVAELATAPNVEAALRDTMHTTLDQLERQVVDHLKGG